MVSAWMMALIESIIAWVLALASVSRVWASSAMASPAGVRMDPGLLIIVMAVLLLTFVLPLLAGNTVFSVAGGCSRSEIVG